jgi:hypothetical protein
MGVFPGVVGSAVIGVAPRHQPIQEPRALPWIASSPLRGSSQ